jgi:hypothetical protein
MHPYVDIVVAMEIPAQRNVSKSRIIARARKSL